jgi:hypothetical protein
MGGPVRSAKRLTGEPQGIAVMPLMHHQSKKVAAAAQRAYAGSTCEAALFAAYRTLAMQAR